MKVFVTGHRGYIGSHLIALLKSAGHQVTGCDIRLFEGCEWEPIQRLKRELIKDLRRIEKEDLVGHDCLIHLAAIANDPMGSLDPALTLSVNREGSIRLAELAKEAGVGRFLFAGSCSIYGQGPRLDLDEKAPYNPLSTYAESKIGAEKAISKLANSQFCPVFLRNATAYGHSPMLRIDLVVNNLLASAHVRGQIKVMSDGTPWRPLVHCKDIARAFMAFMCAPRSKVYNQAVNIGHNRENYQVRDVANLIKKVIPDADIVYTGEVGSDPRNYRVNFDKLYKILPDFKLEYSVERGIRELHQKLKAHGFSLSDFDGDQFVRVRTIEKSLHLLSEEMYTL